MTAEVAILNHNAVALAADSAASLIDDTGAVSKVYNSLTKIHAPIVAEPFGVMFYGDVHFAGIPWDTVFKTYRTQNPDKCATLAEYATNFLCWLSTLAESRTLLEQLKKRQTPDEPLSTGLVFAGFGADQLLPAICEYRVTVSPDEGNITIPLTPSLSAEINHPRDALILPFAQMQPVVSFITGYDADYHTMTQNFISEQVHAALSAHQTGLVDKPANIVEAILQRLDEAKDAYMTPRSRAIVQTIAALPKEELAVAAESLVNMSSLWQQVTPGSATVGGPIDVAVISKGDGLIWTKRKHYFKPELNLRYIERLRTG